jgi:hypothetical protein
MSFASRGFSFEKIKRLFRRAASSVEAIADGEQAVATPPPGAASTWKGDADRETSTNAQTEGAANEPWSGNS